MRYLKVGFTWLCRFCYSLLPHDFLLFCCCADCLLDPKEAVTVKCLQSLMRLTEYVTLVPRFTASVPSSWVEMQEDQQHLNQQTLMQPVLHSRTWKLCTDNNRLLQYTFVSFVYFLINPLTHISAKSKVDKFSKITNWVKLKNRQQHNKALLNNFPMKGNTLGFCQ